MSKNDKQRALVPRLRFPEFRDAPGWREKKLVSVFENITNGKANAQDHVEDGEYPLFDRSEIIKRSDSFMFDAEAVIIPGEGMRFQPRHFKGKFNLHQRAYALLGCKEDSAFTFYALDRSKGLLARKAVQSTVLSLRLPILENFTIGCPSSAEQRKIADCLGSLDDLIAAEGRKLEALREHKNGLMQQLFPREGETVPRLQFPEFRSAEEWRKKTLASIFAKIKNGKANSQDHVEDGKYPLFDRSEVIKRSNSFMFDEEAVIIPGEGMQFRPIYFDGKFNLHQRAYALLECKEDSKFTFYALDRFKGLLARKAVQSTVLSLRLPILESFAIGCPSIAEQRKIADCLTSLDALIAAQAAKLDALRTHKWGLMQQLFPSPEDLGT